MKFFASKRTQRLTNFALAAMLVVSTLTASVPFLFNQKANAAPGVSYTTPVQSQSDWTVDRSVPSGGWSVDSAAGSVTLNVDQTHANTSATFYQTEGVSKALPAGTDSVKASVVVPSDWATKPNLRVGLWGVAQNTANTGPSYPIIEYAANVSGFTGWRVWNANDSTWNTVSATTNVGGQNTVEIVSNFTTGNYDFYVNNSKVYSYSANGYTTFTNIILNSFNAGTGNPAGNYTALWNNIQNGVLTPDYSNVYVATNGSDSNYGTDASAPFATIQKALNSVATNGTVHIADGTYTEKLSFTKGNMTVVGQSKAGTIIKPLSNEYGQGFTSEGFGNITVSKLTVQADGPTAGGSAMKFHNAQNITLSNIDVNGSGYIRGIDINGVDGVTLNNVKVNGFGKNGIAFTSKFAAADAYTTNNVSLTDVQSNGNGWSGLAFYTAGGAGVNADVTNVSFAGANQFNNNGQVGIFFEGGSDAGYGAHTTPLNSVTGMGGASVDLSNTTITGNGLNIVNYQLKNVYATSATINGAVGNSMTTPQIQAAEASIIDHNDYNSYGDVILDTNAPIVAITSPADGAVIKGNVTVTGTVTDTDPSVSYLTVTNDTTHQQVAVQNVNTGLTNPSVSWNTADFANGSYTIHLEAKDAAGNEDGTVSVKNIHVTVDNAAPDITVKASPDTIGSAGIYSKLSLKLHDNNAVVSYKINNNALVNVTPNQYSDVNGITVGSYHGAHAGSNTITVYDAAGNSASLDFFLDNTGPTITVKGSPNTVGSNDTYTKLGLSLHDDTLVAGYSFNGGAFQAVSANAYSDINDIFLGSYHGEVPGSNTVTVYDIAGNSTSYTFTLDNVKPTADIVFPPRGPSATFFNVQFSEAVNVADATNPANYYLTNWPNAGGTGNLVGHATVSYDSETKTATVFFTTPGWYVSPEQLWGVSGVRDLAGNVMDNYSELSSPNVPPTAPGTPTTTTPTNSLTSNWTWTAATDPADPAEDASGVNRYQYKFTNGTTVLTDWTNTTSTSATTTAPSEGTYQLHVRAIDNAGNIGEEATGTVVIDQTPPVVTLTPDSTVYGGDNSEATIQGSTGDSSSFVFTITNDANDEVIVNRTGSEFAAQPFDVSELESGTYTVNLTGTDAAGNTTTANPITIAVDNDGPAVGVNGSSFTTGQPVVLTGTVDADASSVNVAIFDADGNPVENGPATINGTTWSYAVSSTLTVQNYSVFARAYDALGNFTDDSATLAVTAPAQTPTATSVTVTPTPLITSPAAAAVLGATTDNTDNTTDTGVKGATDNKTADAVNSDANKGTIFGLAWYWWILILAALAAIAWFIIAAIRRRNADEA